MMLAEGFLHRMQLAVRGGEAFDGGDRGALGLGGQHGAGLDAATIDMDDAGAALAGVAAHMGAGHAENVSQRLDQKRARSEEHTSELQSLMRISYAVFCLKKKKK